MSVPPSNQSTFVGFKDSRSAVRIMQLVVGVFMLGVIAFGGIVIYILLLPLPKPPARATSPIVVAYVGIVAAVINIVLRFVVPGFVMDLMTRKFSQGISGREMTKLDLYPAYFIGLVIGAALLEGAAFFNIVAAMIDRQTWTFAIVGILLALMAAAFPTIKRVDNWADEQLRTLRLDTPR